MPWIRLHIQCEPAQPGHEIAMAWLAEAGFSMFQESPEGGLDAFVQDTDCNVELVEVIRNDLEPLGLRNWHEYEVEEENWNAQWEKDYPEVCIGNTIRIRAPFHPEVGNPGVGSFETTLTIQPRMAFGTGHHGTTFGILSEMVGMEWEGTQVLDMGCGSGVLGIYAARRNARRVLAVDIDDWSVRNTRENAVLNGIEEGDAFEVRAGGADVLQDGDHGQFDVVIANINRNILLEGMASYAQVLSPNGTLILSGFMEPDIAPLQAAAEQYGLILHRVHRQDEWRILTLRR